MLIDLPPCIAGAVYVTHLALTTFSGQVPTWSLNPLLTMTPAVYVDYEPDIGMALLIETRCNP